MDWPVHTFYINEINVICDYFASAFSHLAYVFKLCLCCITCQHFVPLHGWIKFPLSGYTMFCSSIHGWCVLTKMPRKLSKGKDGHSPCGALTPKYPNPKKQKWTLSPIALNTQITQIIYQRPKYAIYNYKTLNGNRRENLCNHIVDRFLGQDTKSTNHKKELTS